MKSESTFASDGWLCMLIASQMGLQAHQVHPQMRLVGDLGIDSLELQSLLMAIDDLTGVMPEGAQMQRIITVADLHGLVLRLLEAQH